MSDTHARRAANLEAHRMRLDGTITALAAELGGRRPGAGQTHHRGQASTLLTQAGVDIGVTDLLLIGEAG